MERGNFFGRCPQIYVDFCNHNEAMCLLMAASLASCPLNNVLSQELWLIPHVSVMAQPLWESKIVHIDLEIIKDDLQGKDIGLWPVCLWYTKECLIPWS